jgi:putative transposase
VARVRRLDLPDGLFHVTVHGVDATAICRSNADYDRFVRLLGPVARDRGWTCYSLCVMSTHYHLILESKIADLAGGMETLNGRYAKLFNRDHVRWGHLFGARYGSKPIETTEYLFEALRYVSLNPVRAGARRRPEEWSWATYRALMGLDPAPDFFDVDVVLRLLASTREEARRVLREYVNAAVPEAWSA